MNKKPNIVLIVLDTARAQNFSCYGYPRSTTPNIDAIAKEGTLFLNTITPSPWTLPSHAAIFTGMLPSKHGAHEKHKFLDGCHKTLPEVLKSTGYYTCAISNNSWVSPYFGFSKGFDIFFKLWQLFQDDSDPLPALRKRFLEERDARGIILELLRQGSFKTFANGLYKRFFYKKRYDCGARRINRIVSHSLLNILGKKQPFFLFINYLETHLKYQAPEPYYGQFLPEGMNKGIASKVNQDAFKYIAGQVEMDRLDFEVLTALYDGELAYLDFRIGELYSHLKGKGLLDDTLLIITSDHGENLGEHNLMDHQYCLYDTLLRVPLIVRYPGVFPAGEMVSTQVQLVDIFPTIMDILQTDDKEMSHELHGQSLLPHKLGDQERTFAVAEYLGPQPAIEIMAKRYPGSERYLNKFNRSLFAIRTSSWKFIESSDGRNELYNIRDDPGEVNNLINTQPAKARELERTLKEWKESNNTRYIASEQKVIDGEVKKRLEALGYFT
ncbi:MAG: hypothetical protein A3G93_07885 [Nitrospinae bacterium RIFCSPLOWO2_12_FULL_45_22]|nr:MAG: hypothetical protein A3G93_07885 [Nitrospinae bacterium RIFCSPLOWO2_12_FULL_45_22]